MMPMSSHEQRILESIERECRASDPAFVAKFEAPVRRIRRRGWRRLFHRHGGRS